MSRNFPRALPHGELEEVFDGIYFVPGSVEMKAGVTFRVSRNMVVVKNGDALTLINSMRLTEDGLEKLDALGKVEHVLRIAGFHGMDDPFYKDRYDAKVWAVEHAPYATGFDNAKRNPKTYFDADERMNASTELPIPNASLYYFSSSRPCEALIHLDRDGGILLTGDALQNWDRTDEYFNLTAKIMMKTMGFIKAHNIGPGWIKAAKPDPKEIRGVLDLEFEHVLPVHGRKVIGDAKQKFTPAIDRVSLT